MIVCDPSISLPPQFIYHGWNPTSSAAFHDRPPRRSIMTLGTILLIILILALLGMLPTWGYSRSWGYGPSGGVGLIVIILIILLLMGRI
jgi:hypothetical protein